MVKAIDMGNYFRIPSDNRDLNYGKFYSKGKSKISEIEEYTSHNTTLLNIEETKKLLMTLDFIKKDLL